MKEEMRSIGYLCPHCKKPYTPDAEELALRGMDEGEKAVFYKGEGCPECRHSGYAGRRAALEILMINPELRALINRNADEEEMLTAARKNGLVTMRGACRDLVLRGITTAEEAARTISTTADN